MHTLFVCKSDIITLHFICTYLKRYGSVKTGGHGKPGPNNGTASSEKTLSRYWLSSSVVTIANISILFVKESLLMKEKLYSTLNVKLFRKLFITIVLCYAMNYY